MYEVVSGTVTSSNLISSSGILVVTLGNSVTVSTTGVLSSCNARVNTVIWSFNAEISAFLANNSSNDVKLS